TVLCAWRTTAQCSAPIENGADLSAHRENVRSLAPALIRPAFCPPCAQPACRRSGSAAPRCRARSHLSGSPGRRKHGGGDCRSPSCAAAQVRPSCEGRGDVERGADPGIARAGRAVAGSMKLLIYLTMVVGAGCQALASERVESVSG